MNVADYTVLAQDRTHDVSPGNDSSLTNPVYRFGAEQPSPRPL